MKNKYYIVNEFDRPYERLVAVAHEGKLYYLNRAEESSLKSHDGMDMDRATPVEDFGFDITQESDRVAFVQTRPSIVRYENTEQIRPWQGSSKFTLPAFQGL